MDPGAGITRHTTEKELKITTKKLPVNPEEYPGWNFALRTACLSSGADPDLVLQYLQDLDALTSEELRTSTFPEGVADIR